MSDSEVTCLSQSQTCGVLPIAKSEPALRCQTLRCPPYRKVRIRIAMSAYAVSFLLRSLALYVRCPKNLKWMQRFTGLYDRLLLPYSSVLHLIRNQAHFVRHRLLGVLHSAEFWMYSISKSKLHLKNCKPAYQDKLIFF